MPNNEVKLKPCPFCGGRAYIAVNSISNDLFIDCEHMPDCGNNINMWLRSSLPLQKQIKDWNTRYIEPKKKKNKLIDGKRILTIKRGKGGYING